MAPTATWWSRYSSLARLNIYPAYVFGEGGSTEFGQVVNTLANPNLSWETTTGFNFGLDFSFLKNRLTGSRRLLSHHDQ